MDKWTCIAIVVFFLMCFGVLTFENYQSEETKRVELQLKIEMVKAGVTNIPTIK